MSPPTSPSIGLAKMPKFYYQAEDFEVNFVPHFILPIFLLEGRMCKKSISSGINFCKYLINKDIDIFICV